MTKLVVSLAVSLDGYAAGPDQSLETRWVCAARN
jgi:hypothetical protein